MSAIVWQLGTEKLAMSLASLLRNHRAAVIEIAARHGARNVRVFGSVARGQTGPDSDIDLLVELDPQCSLLDHAALWMELNELLGVKVDVVSDRGLKPRIRDRVLAEAIAL